jgi:response regulator RpfG family c-di-GMP phosphodiesterase
MMTTREQPRVLCVDDEQRVVDGLALHLRKDYDVHVACSGEQALRKLAEMKGAAVVVSDMRMPGMDGATLLHEVMQRYPDVTRILLTGDPGRDAAALAINKGQIFRFLTKPCPADQLRVAIEAGVMQHRLVNAERAVMQETLIGCIRALIDVLAITNPVAFGRASRLKRLVTEFAGQLGYASFWQLEAAAMLSQIGYMALPVALVDKIYYGERLTAEERTQADGVPLVATKLLGHIPRLESVMQILTALNSLDAQVVKLGDGTVGLGARILGLALEYDAHMAQGRTIDVAVESLRGRAARFDAALIEKFAAHVGAQAAESAVLEMPLRHVLMGMIILQDVRTHLGTLLVPKGFEVTAVFLERIPRFGPELLAQRVRVMVPVPRPAG